ncbi:helix-turn-helix transcriptional regulator [Erwinia typographi]|uniref:helix-turn-helix transcriptional regulator n=1 Tax=Erwinia typographi TaxID=371042 RepID=UPI000A06D7C9|nr:helix-turn-helix transcriptional regulator [Erwinia typographi]
MLSIAQCLKHYSVFWYKNGWSTTMCTTDRVLISKDSFLHLGLCERRNHLPVILKNELKPITSAFNENKNTLLAYVDDRLDERDVLKWLRNAKDLYNNISVINISVKKKSQTSGLYKITLTQYERKCEYHQRNKNKIQEKKFAEFHKKQNVKLTRTEKEVLSLMISGQSIADISKTLNCSAKVIYTHRYNIIKKYGYRTFNELYISILGDGQ